MKELRAFNTSSKELIAGFVEEFDKYYEITGVYVETELSHDVYGNGDSKATLQYRAFSPVGELVQTARFPYSKIANEAVLPPSLIHHLTHVLHSAQQTAQRKAQLQNMRVPSRVGSTPEELLALNAQYIRTHGRLPAGNGTTEAMRTIMGNFQTQPTSPYREG